jgi:hypothetical protein
MVTFSRHEIYKLKVGILQRIIVAMLSYLGSMQLLFI